MIVKAAPLFATILCRWLGRLAIPIGEADSVADCAMLLAIQSMSMCSTKTTREQVLVIWWRYDRCGRAAGAMRALSSSVSLGVLRKVRWTPDHDQSQTNGRRVPQISSVT